MTLMSSSVARQQKVVMKTTEDGINRRGGGAFEVRYVYDKK